MNCQHVRRLKNTGQFDSCARGFALFGLFSAFCVTWNLENAFAEFAKFGMRRPQRLEPMRRPSQSYASVNPNYLLRLPWRTLRFANRQEGRSLQEQADVEDELFDLPLFGDAQWWEAPQSWPKDLAKLFVALGPHDAATDFIVNAPMALSTQAFIYQALCELPVNEFDLQALLYPAGSHLLTVDQFKMLLSYTGYLPSELRVLDIGSGDGCITKNLRALGVGQLVLSETSLGMATKLRLSGHHVWCEDVAVTADERVKSGESFSLVSMLNVLDRCASPQRLCRAAHQLLRDKGHLLLAIPLPFMASYYGPETKWSGKPVETVQLSGSSHETWESDAQVLLEDFLPSCGFQPIAVSRLPYLSGGDEEDGCIELDDIVVLARKT